MKDGERLTSPFLCFEDFKEYRRRCKEPMQNLKPTHQFYNMAVKEYHSRIESKGTQDEEKFIEEFEADDDRILSKFMTPEQLKQLQKKQEHQ
jgi:hypothetical protein